MKTRMSPRILSHRSRERVNATISAESTIGTGECRACLKHLPPGSGSLYCSGRCRLRGWAVRELAKAFLDGKADGLRAKIHELGRKA
jgi:hypothetical protein